MANDSTNISFIESNSRNSEDQTTKIFSLSCYGSYGALGTVFNLLLLCYQLNGFKKRKAYEYLLFVTSFVDFLNCLTRCTLYIYAITYHDEFICKYCGLFITIFICSTTMLLTVNMLHRYLSLYHPAISKNISTNRGIILCTTMPILGNILIYGPLLPFDTYGFDAVGSCSMKALTTTNNKWILLSGIEMFLCYIVNIVLGALVIQKLRGHVTNVQDMKTQLMKESKQIIKLMSILTIGPLMTTGVGFVTRLLPSKTNLILWASRFYMLISPSMIALMPIITIIVIKDYRKHFSRFLTGADNQVTSIVQVGSNLKVQGNS